MGIGYSKEEETPLYGLILKEWLPDIPEELRQFDYPFENLALEGGGCKTYAYLGSLKVLEELGILQKIRRFAGASGGAVIACLLAVGYDVNGLIDFFAVDLTKISSDARCGFAALLPNLFSSYGWHPGRKVHEYIKRHIAQKCDGNGDITFQELYDSRGVELCVCVSNVTKMGLEYCHPKTTPDMAISDAIRMTISLPGFYQPYKYYKQDKCNVYVDGGMVCNYPVFVFDGWYLSMEQEDAFLHKLGEDEAPFGEYNERTIGMLVYATEDAEMLRTGLHERYKGLDLPRPDTPLARERGADCDRQLALLDDRAQMALAARRFWAALQASDVNRDGKISSPEFFKAVQMVPKEDLLKLFDTSFATIEEFKAMDENKDGEVTYAEFIRFMDRRGLNFRETMEGCDAARPLTSLSGFGGALLDTMSMTISKLLIKPRDLQRTIGVHTDYILTTDFNMTDEDRQYIVQRSAYATVAFLKEFRLRQEEA